MTTTIEITIPEEHLKVLTLLKEGDTVKGIADKLLMSKGKVKKIKGIYLAHFECRNSPQLVGILMHRDII